MGHKLKLVRVVRRLKKNPDLQIDADADLVKSIELDSLDMLELLMEAEEIFDCDFPDDPVELNTLNKLQQYAEQKTPK